MTRDSLEWSGEIVVDVTLLLLFSLLSSLLLSTTPTHSPAKMITQAKRSSPLLSSPLISNLSVVRAGAGIGEVQGSGPASVPVISNNAMKRITTTVL